MTAHLRAKGCDRILRLFAVACCRRVAHMLLPEAHEGIDLAEKVAEGRADPSEQKRTPCRNRSGSISPACSAG
ncbi:MAG: hypothetical protein K2W96_27380 [Gemmataceae bacterium]|nr:hypothetical protein [Gemmataceae bacterium]